MILGMQDFDFTQIHSNLPNSNQFCPNFAFILLKFRLNFAQISPKSNQIFPNLIKLPKKILIGGAVASPAPTPLFCPLLGKEKFFPRISALVRYQQMILSLLLLITRKSQFFGQKQTHILYKDSVTSAVRAGDAVASPATIFGQNWFDLSEFSRIWAKLRRNWVKSE